jgi:hypothetical protein
MNDLRAEGIGCNNYFGVCNYVFPRACISPTKTAPYPYLFPERPLIIAMDGILLNVTLDGPTRWLLVIAVGLTIFYAVMRPMRKKKDPLGKSGLRPGLAGQRAVERDMSNLLVELSEMARQVTAQLDTRTLKLEMLLKEADERIAALKEAMRQAPAGNGAATPASAAPAASPAAEAPAIDPRHLAVYELADQNLAAPQIANKLGRPRGEVELILALRERSIS